MRRMRLAAAGLVLAMIPGMGAGASAETPSDQVGRHARFALEARDRAEQFAKGFSKGATLESQIVRAASTLPDTANAIAVDVPAMAFEQALRSLYAEAHVPQPARISLPEPLVAAAVAPVLAAVVTAGRMVRDALADLTARERSWLLPHLLEAQSDTETNGRVAELVSRVNAADIASAAATVARALDGFPPLPGGGRSSWVDPTTMIEIASTASDTHDATLNPRMLLVDLGGGDTYSGPVASVGPGSALLLPVSVVLDAGGNDSYSTSGYNNTALQNGMFGQAVGLGGIGILVDRWGSDTYYAISPPTTPSIPCVATPGSGNTYRQFMHVQGVGALGVGVIADVSGNDFYYAYNYQPPPSSPCHYAKIFTFAQGAGLHRGIGMVVDDTGDELYLASSQATGAPGNLLQVDHIAHVYAQGFGAGGAGLLADKEGDDTYIANSYSTSLNAGNHKGSFAFVYAQGSVYGLTEEYARTLQGTLLPPLVTGSVQAIDYCLSLGSALTGTSGPLCNGAGVGILVDLLGADSFDASPSSVESPTLCTWASNAVTSSQGSAAWGGLALLANLDAEDEDTFQLAPFATGGPCNVYRVRAHSYGQGFGGPTYADPWDNPYTLSRAFSLDASQIGLGVSRIVVPAIGILVSGGVPCRDSAFDPAAPLGVPMPSWIGCPLGTAGLVASPDHYLSTPTASTTALGITSSSVQGASGAPSFSVIPFLPGLPTIATGIGVGINVDAGGNDEYVSVPNTATPFGSAQSLAQGGTFGGIAALVNVGGDDSYRTEAILNGNTQFPFSLGLGYAQAGFGELLPPIAVFVEIGGNDTYQPLPAAGCALNGGLFSPELWGLLNSSPPACNQPDTITVGLDAASDTNL